MNPRSTLREMAFNVGW
jgi:hypothetical protein